ncbi:prepilin-type N-terminal cleavage/methylation domain-containing protein [Pseudoduganella sp. DS3]|uniref:Prepilin-type N-terminal cleavage/methylation domain-containing protein n=1 Tax=Pseudoduganella guangdongensis TaxID=2692179 RepID=A0A6N9HLL9_9BURK|nr:prepilin-type N-terminal cleavage/methylation domain-containing protein [Pseudoduganella guangdongensis]MYN04147.1 prepilin-type N-terminal cleavage/methylation domain-containing protein [Pseudoduganella guangdongensis]
MKNARGFTLVELLVAITVLAIVAVMGWRGLDGIVRSREQLTQNMEQTRGIQLTFAQMQSDLEQIADKGLLRQRPNIMADSGRLVFIRTVLAENAASQLQVVSYLIHEGVLVRRESRLTRDLVQLQALWQAALGDASPQGAVALQSGVTSMDVRVWESGSWKAAGNSSTAFSDVTPGGAGGAGGEGADGAVVGGPGSGGIGGGGPGGTGTSGAVRAPTEGPTGLEMTLLIRGQSVPLTKVFLLGAV